MPSYNHAPYVEACLRSIFAQTSPPAQLLVIDDGSTDGSRKIIERSLAACPFPAELIVRPNRGLSATLNEALALTRGTYVAYLASDDLWHPDRLKIGVATLEASPQSVLSFGACYLIDERDHVLAVGVYPSTEGHRAVRSGQPTNPPRADLEELLSCRIVPFSPTVTYRRDAVERFGWNEASRMEDVEMYLLLASVGPFAFIPRPLGSWRLHAGNTSKDLDAMYAEASETQRRVAARLDISAKDLERYQRSVGYAYGEQYLRAGQWRRGVGLTLRNLSATPHSVTAVAERWARIVMPAKMLRHIADAIRQRES